MDDCFAESEVTLYDHLVAFDHHVKPTRLLGHQLADEDLDEEGHHDKQDKPPDRPVSKIIKCCISDTYDSPIEEHAEEAQLPEEEHPYANVLGSLREGSSSEVEQLGTVDLQFYKVVDEGQDGAQLEGC